jgi:hypothetical protein|tara:strand:- start:1995 stop:2363 length:369 start_codon:yes stop_codon:yes gene_type:complete
MNVSQLLAALIVVESSGDPKAIGDNGLAVGCLQITPAVIKDVNRVFDMDFTLDDRYEVHHSKNIANLYLAYWGSKYERNTGFQANAEVYARIWNGGPNGWNKKSTDKYWYKVKEVLDSWEDS